MCSTLAQGKTSTDPFYVKGTVTSIGEKGNYYKNVYFTDGKTELLIYTLNMGNGISGVKVGDTITVYGYIKNYNGTIEMATGPNQTYVYVLKVETSGGATDGDQSGNDEIPDTNHTYTDFTSDEKSLFNSIVGIVIPFIPNDEYYVEESEEYADCVCFYTFGNTEAEFNAYRALFSSFTYEGTETDEYGDAWYYYSKGNVMVDMSYYYYENEYVVDVYVYLASDDSGDSGDVGGGDQGGSTTPDGSIDYGTLSAPVTTTYAYNACKDLASGKTSANQFYVKGTITRIGESGSYYKNVYFTDGTTEMLIYTLNKGNGISGVKVGDTITAYGYIKNYDGTIEMATGPNQTFVYVVKVENSGGTTGGGTTGGDQGGTTDPDVNLITNDGKGLPTGTNGIFDVDFTKGNYVQNVTDQGYYIDGCPTMGSPAVLVIPVEFKDVAAQSKGYTIDKLEKIFNGTGNDTIYYSVHDYFYISSYGKLDLDITVVDSWFCPEYNSDYYADAVEKYGGDKVAIGDQLILNEALAYLSTVMDLSKFDSDKNGVIDAVVMVNTLDIDSDVDFQWAYRYWNIYADDDGNYYEYDEVSANDCIWMCYEFMFEGYDEEMSETNYDHSNPLNAYTFIHEFSHILGADDYYDTAYEGSPMGGYDMMDAMTGDHNPYTKFNYGWLTSSKLIVTDSTVTVTLDAYSNAGDTLIIANNWDESLGAYQEYYVIMYYTATGLNAGEGGYFSYDGIVVYHINSSLYAEDYEGETYYDVYNNNTSASDEDGTADNLIEYVTTAEGNYTFMEGDTLPTVTDDSGNTLIYTFTVDELTASSATLTFTRK